MCIFHSWINPFIINGLEKRFNLVSNQNNLLVHFINVGQADAIAINLPDGKTMLIDNGSKKYNVDYIKYLKENVVHSKHNNKLDYLVLTHADSDHIGGTMKLLKNFEINTIFMPQIVSNSQTFEEIYNYVMKNCNYKTLGGEFEINKNGYKIKFFEQLNSVDTNNSSQVVKLEYKKKSFLFTGDITTDVEDDYILAYSNELNCDVLKVAHHGSKTSTSQMFLNRVTPQYAVLSVGENNDYNHPSDEIVDRLISNNIKILRTDKNGNILFVVGNDYNLLVLDGNYYITGLTLDYSIYILCLDLILFVVAILIVLKGNKVKNRHIEI